MTRLAVNTALITDAACCIGLVFAKAYTRQGARLAIADVDAARAREAADGLGPAAVAVKMGVTHQDSTDTAVSGVAAKFGQIDVLINDAALVTAASIVEFDRADADRIFDVDVEGTFFMMQAIATHMIDHGIKSRIINMARQVGRRGEPLVAGYCATKATVISLTQSAEQNLIECGIKVNAISPVVVDGEHWGGVDALFAKYEGQAPGQRKKEGGDAVPFGRMGTANDLTGMLVFLASNEAGYIVAPTYNVAGRQWIH
ncbi:MAG: SDR family oxidoreductase [Pseudomonadota bacterium]